MTVTLDLTPDIEQGLLAQARAQGLSLQAFLQELVARQAHGSASVGTVPELPVLHLGVMGALHRRDLYDDAC